MVVVTIVAASVITAAAGAGITGDVAVPADGTGMTADRADLEVRGDREMAAIPGADAAELWEISMPLMCVVNS